MRVGYIRLSKAAAWKKKQKHKRKKSYATINRSKKKTHEAIFYCFRRALSSLKNREKNGFSVKRMHVIYRTCPLRPRICCDENQFSLCGDCSE